MNSKMNLSNDEVLDIEIDPLLLQMYEKLSLEEILESNDVSVYESALFNEIKCKETTSSIGNKSKNISLKDTNTYVPGNKKDILSDEIVEKNTDNNDESETDENFKQLFSNLNLSDEKNDTSKLKERAPIRPSRRARHSRSQNTHRRDIVDTSQVSSERLRFLSGSRFSELDDSISSNLLVNDRFSFEENISSSILSSSHSENNSPDSNKNESFYDDSTSISTYSPTNSVSSGYETSSPQSISSSPPKLLTLSQHSEIQVPSETIDDEDIVNQIIEIESTRNYAPTQTSLSISMLDEKAFKEKMVQFLKDEENNKQKIVDCFQENQNEINKLPPSSSKSSSTNVPSPHDADLMNVSPRKRSNHKNISVIESSVTSSVVSNENAAFTQNINLTCVSPVKANCSKPESISSSKTPIACRPLKNAAKKALRSSLSNEKFHSAQEKIYRRVNDSIMNNQGINVVEENFVPVIYVENEAEIQTNLHLAVLNSEAEEIYCLVEIHKQFNESFQALNLRDKHLKTALDYAIQNDLTLVINYLKENNACQSVNL